MTAATDPRLQHEAQVAQRAVERTARDRQVLDTQTANALAKLRRDQENRERQWRQWDNQIAGDEFGSFLASRGLRLEESYPDLPYDETAELAVIGAVCIEGATAGIAIGPLHPLHFRQKEAVDALRAIASLRQQQRQGKEAPIDATTIASQMRKQQTFVVGGRGELGTSEFLLHCIKQCPNSANIAAYIEAVLDASRLRYQHWLGLAYARETLRAEAEPAHLLNAMRGALDTIEHRGFVDLKTVFEAPK